jgi:hypothetical protein
LPSVTQETAPAVFPLRAAKRELGQELALALALGQNSRLTGKTCIRAPPKSWGVALRDQTADSHSPTVALMNLSIIQSMFLASSNLRPPTLAPRQPKRNKGAASGRGAKREFQAGSSNCPHHPRISQSIGRNWNTLSDTLCILQHLCMGPCVVKSISCKLLELGGTRAPLQSLSHPFSLGRIHELKCTITTLRRQERCSPKLGRAHFSKAWRTHYHEYTEHCGGSSEAKKVASEYCLKR